MGVEFSSDIAFDDKADDVRRRANWLLGFLFRGLDSRMVLKTLFRSSFCNFSNIPALVLTTYHLGFIIKLVATQGKFIRFVGPRQELHTREVPLADPHTSNYLLSKLGAVPAMSPSPISCSMNSLTASPSRHQCSFWNPDVVIINIDNF